MSESAQASHSLLSNLGLNLDFLTAGPLNVRGHSGYVCRWGEGWFWELRDGGAGWSFSKNDQQAIDFRVQFLLDVFKRKTSNLPHFFADSAPLPLEDG